MTQKLLVCFIVLSALVWSSSAKVPECPWEDDPKHPILFPDPTDCGAFLECAFGDLVQLKCYPGLYYNIDKQYCDYKENVDCGLRPTTTTVPPPQSEDN